MEKPEDESDKDGAERGRHWQERTQEEKSEMRKKIDGSGDCGWKSMLI